jgi:hypothetical protein
VLSFVPTLPFGATGAGPAWLSHRAGVVANMVVNGNGDLGAGFFRVLAFATIVLLLVVVLRGGLKQKGRPPGPPR